MEFALEISGLTKTYDNGFEALKGIDLAVQKGDFFALLGPNGAGKSTTLSIVSSLVKKTAGAVAIFGFDIEKDVTAAKKCLGVVPQEFNFNQFEKVYDIVVTQAGYYGIAPAVARKNAEKYLKKLGLWDKRDTPSRMLSGGMKRRLMIARALVHEPELLILDEPTAGVDIELRRSMWQFLQEINRQGKTIILTTHYLEEAEALCRNIAIIDKGCILKNTSKKALLDTLHAQTYVVDPEGALPSPFKLESYSWSVNDDGALEVVLEKGSTVNQLVSALGDQGVEIQGIRPKANRLEELFVRLVETQSSGE